MSYDAGEWKPGDVAMVTGRWAWNKPHSAAVAIRDVECWTTGSRDVMDHEVSVARRLVVIDPEDAEQVERLAWLLAEKSDQPVSYTALAAAVRDYANPTPPIEEPQGLGAVVEDADGVRSVRWNVDGAVAPWRRQHNKDDGAAMHERWCAIKAVRVLSPGVPPETTP
jgi:hypothetical protein